MQGLARAVAGPPAAAGCAPWRKQETRALQCGRPLQTAPLPRAGVDSVLDWIDSDRSAAVRGLGRVTVTAVQVRGLRASGGAKFEWHPSHAIAASGVERIEMKRLSHEK